MVCYACMALLLKRLSLNLETPTILVYLFGFTTVFFLVFSAKTQASFQIDISLLLLLCLAAVFAFSGNYFDLQALSLAPNAGYAAAIKGGQIILITIAAFFLFKDQSITWAGAAGVGCIVLGIWLLSTQK